MSTCVLSLPVLLQTLPQIRSLIWRQKKGEGDTGRRGEIVLRLSRIDAAEAGNIAIRNGELDIERSGFN